MAMDVLGSAVYSVAVVSKDMDSCDIGIGIGFLFLLLFLGAIGGVRFPDDGVTKAVAVDVSITKQQQTVAIAIVMDGKRRGWSVIVVRNVE